MPVGQIDRLDTETVSVAVATPPARILMVALNYAPELVGCAKYTSELAEELVRRGYTVEVVTGPPYYPAWAVAEGYSGSRWSSEIVNGVRVHRTPLYVPKTPTGLSRLAHLASFGAASFPAAISVARRFRPDIVFAVAPTLAAASTALVAAKACGAATWLHVQDFEVDAAFGLGILRSSGGQGAALQLESHLLQGFDCVSSISPQMVDRLRSKGVHADRVLEFRNWVDVDAVRVFASPNTRYRQELGIGSDQIIALYAGNMAGKQGLELLGEVARLVKDAASPITLLICGDGPAKAGLQLACAGMDNVVFLPLQPVERLPELLGTADIHLLPQRPEAADLVLPSKLTGMLASGRPIVAMAEPGTALAAEVEHCGRAVPATGPAMASALLELCGDRGSRQMLGGGARARAELYWRKSSIIDVFEARLGDLI